MACSWGEGGARGQRAGGRDGFSGTSRRSLSYGSGRGLRWGAGARRMGTFFARRRWCWGAVWYRGDITGWCRSR